MINEWKYSFSFLRIKYSSLRVWEVVWKRFKEYALHGFRKVLDSGGLFSMKNWKRCWIEN